MSRIFLSAPDITGRERELVSEAFDSNYIAPAGPMIARFEEDVKAYTGFKHAVALTTATAALHLGLRLVDVGRGDDVWTASATFIGGTSPISYMGANPVFFDSDVATWEMDVNLVIDELNTANKINKLPKAVMTTDLFGQACDLEALAEKCAEFGIPLISDSAETLGAFCNGKHAGIGATLAAISFNGNKIITTSGGGMLLSDNEAMIERARYLSTQARLNFPYYQHDEIGYNYRMSNVSAAIGIGQLEQIEQKVARRRSIFSKYAQAFDRFDCVTMMPEPSNRRSTNWLTCLTVDPQKQDLNSDAVRSACDELEIEVRPLWKPMHLQPVFKGARFIGSGVCENLFETGLCLPSGSGMSDEDQDRVIEAISTALEKG